MAKYTPAQIAIRPAWHDVCRLYQWQELRSGFQGPKPENWLWLMSDPTLTDEFFNNVTTNDSMDKILGFSTTCIKRPRAASPPMTRWPWRLPWSGSVRPSGWFMSRSGLASVPRDESTVK